MEVMSSVCCDKRHPNGDDYVFADTRPDKATIQCPAALYPAIFDAIEASISFQSFTNDLGGFALEIGGELVAVDARFGELCNHRFSIAPVRFHELTH